MKSLTKKMSLKILLKVSTDLAILISTGKSLQSFSAEATKAQSLRVVKVLKLGVRNCLKF